MIPEVVYAFEAQNVKEAAQLMQEKQIRHLPIISRTKQLVGIVSLGDLAVDTGKEKMIGETLIEVSRPSQPSR
jgi:CBS-domain-containing membrane protein